MPPRRPVRRPRPLAPGPLARRPLALGPVALRSVALCAGAVVAVTLTACTPSTPEPTASPEPVPTTSAAPEPEGPQLHPEGSAEDNLPLFAAVTAQVWAGESRAAGQAYVDALTAAGFDPAAMQVTADLTTIGNPVETLLFSVRWDEGKCLVGQVGPSTGEPATAVMPVLEQGRCLVGETRPID